MDTHHSSHSGDVGREAMGQACPRQPCGSRGQRGRPWRQQQRGQRLGVHQARPCHHKQQQLTQQAQVVGLLVTSVGSNGGEVVGLTWLELILWWFVAGHEICLLACGRNVISWGLCVAWKGLPCRVKGGYHNSMLLQWREGKIWPLCQTIWCVVPQFYQ